jgi:hypothetical protein
MAAGIASCAVGLWARDARAAPALLVDLTYTSDAALPDCPSEGEFRRTVQRQVGYDPFRADASERVLVEVRGSERGVEGAIVWSDPSGQRHGERHFASAGRACAPLAANLSFAVAVQLQLALAQAQAEGQAVPSPTPDAATSLPAKSVSTKSEPAPAPAAPVVPAPAAPEKDASSLTEPAERPSTPRSRAPLSLFLGLGAQAEQGMAPVLLAEGRAFVLARRGAWSAELGAAAAWPASHRTSGGAGFRERLLLGTTGVCGHFDPLALCAVGRVGKIGVEGIGVDVPASPSAWVGQLGVRFALQKTLGAFAGRLHADLLWTMGESTVTLNDVGVWTTPVASFVVGFDAMGAVVK